MREVVATGLGKLRVFERDKFIPHHKRQLRGKSRHDFDDDMILL